MQRFRKARKEFTVHANKKFKKLLKFFVVFVLKI